MMKQAKTNMPDEPHELAAVLEAVPATARDGQTGTGAIAIFYGAARYSFELARQRELVEDYAETTGLNLVTEFHDRRSTSTDWACCSMPASAVEWSTSSRQAGPPPTSPEPKQTR